MKLLGEKMSAQDERTQLLQQVAARVEEAEQKGKVQEASLDGLRTSADEDHRPAGSNG